jgi:hypothetical protein
MLLPGQSLVSVDSWRVAEEGSPPLSNLLGIPRPALRSAAVLTCLAEHPPPGSFRPPYGGDAKPIFTIDQLRRRLLPRLPRPEKIPDLATYPNEFERVWLDHLDLWNGRFLHPSGNMEDYARDFTSKFNCASLLLMLDLPEADKEILLVRLVQIGIDMNAIVESGADWGNDGGGHGSGRKWPILLAGILLDDPAMMAVGTKYPPRTFQEDCQTFYLTAEQAGQYPGVAVGTPVWGEWHCGNPGKDPGDLSYRTCCTANAWVGAVLSAHILTGESGIDVRGLWNHPALFDYQDLYMAEQPSGHWKRSWSDFAGTMWDALRANYGPIRK